MDLVAQIHRTLAAKGLVATPDTQEPAAVPLTNQTLDTPPYGIAEYVSCITPAEQLSNVTVVAALPPKVEVLGIAAGNIAGINLAKIEELASTATPDPESQQELVSSVTQAHVTAFATWFINLLCGLSKNQATLELTKRGYCTDDEAIAFLANLKPPVLPQTEFEHRITAEFNQMVTWVNADMEAEAIRAGNQDSFAHKALAQWRITRTQGRQLYKALRATLSAAKRWPQPVGGTFAQQAEAMADAKIEQHQDPAKGQAQKQLKMDSAANQHGSWVQIARRTGRDLAQNGPISVDDITEAMSRQYKVAPGEGDKAHNWKGSIFTTSEWVAVGQIASRLPEAHGRPVTLWALKTWLEANTLNGRGDATSAFNMVKIYNDFKRAHPGMALERCNWYIGEERLATDIRDSIVSGSNKLYGIPVAFMPGAVGAALLPPDYAAQRKV